MKLFQLHEAQVPSQRSLRNLLWFFEPTDFPDGLERQLILTYCVGEPRQDGLE